MRFRTFPDAEPEPPEAVETGADEDARVHDWQLERLRQLGYHSTAASVLVMAAWVHGEHTDLVHRIERLVQRGATLDQAARIVVPLGRTPLS
jgi:hypothetical protein